jgi:T5SS/PEP-CTERM-associated repeat protein
VEHLYFVKSLSNRAGARGAPVFVSLFLIFFRLKWSGQMSMQKTLYSTKLLAGLGLMIGLTPGAYAQSLAEIDSEALFLTQSGATVIELPVGGVQGTPSFGGVTVTADTGSSIGGGIDTSPLIEPTDFAISGIENWNVALDSPAFGFGFEFDESVLAASTFTFTLFSGGAGGTQVGTFTFQRPPTTLSYVGGVTDTAFDYVEIREIVGTNDNDVFGSFAVTSAAGEFWTSGSNGSWDTAGNWTGGTVPILTDNVFITDSATKTITGPAAATTVNALTIDNQDLPNAGGAGSTTVNLSTGAMNVTNGLVVGSTATDSGTSLLDVGAGTLNVGGDTSIRDGGTVSVAAGGTFAPTGAVNLEGGTLSMDSLGAIVPNWTAGTLQVTGAGGLAVNLNGSLGGNPIGIDASKTLDVTNTLTVNSAVIFEVDGGTVNANNLTAFLGTINANSGQINVNSTFLNQGTVNLAGADVTVNTFDASAVNPNFTDGSLTIDGGSFIPFAGVNDFTLSGDPGTPTLTLDNGATMTLSPLGIFTVAPGSGDNGVLNINNGSTLTSGQADIGLVSFLSDGIVNVDGPGSSWDIDGVLNLGNGNVTNQGANVARDQLNVSNGATVTVNGIVTLGTTGRANLSGGSISADGWVRNAASQFVHTGGTLNISTGNFNSGTSNYTLGGTNRPILNLTNGATYTGGGNTNVDILNGELHVLSGSTVNLTTGTASLQVFNTGAGGAAVVEVDGAGSSITSTGGVDIGRLGGDGTLDITNGGSFSVTSSFLVIASSDNTNGSVTVDGTGSSLSVAGSSGLFVGNEGVGTLDVTNGGLVTANILTVADSDTNGTGTGASILTVNGTDGVSPSTLNVTGSSFIGGSVNEDGGVGILNVQAGGLYNSNGGIIGSGDGSGPDGTGTVNVTGTNSFWNALANGSGSIFVGDTGAGTLNVDTGGRVDAGSVFIGRLTGSDNAAMNLDGGSTVVNVQGVFVVGNQRQGSLTLTNGATLNTSTTTNSDFLIGNSSLADNSSVLIDNSSIIHSGTGRVAVGDDSNGVASSLTLQNGGSFTGNDSIMLVADQGGSTGNLVVDGEGSTLTIGRLLMGDNGAGTATVSNGADLIVNAPGSQIGNLEVSAFGGGGSGTMTVTDPGSTVTIGNWLSVGDEGTADGTLNIENGGAVSSAGHAYIARVSSGSTGVINVQDLDTGDGSSGSSLNVGQNLFLGGNASGNGGDATLNVNAGGTVNVTGQLKLWEDGKVNLNGGTINAASIDLADPLAAPFPNFTFTSGTFRFTAGTTLGTETLDDLLGPGVPTLIANKNLVVTDEAALTAPLRLNGGSLTVGSVFNNDTANLDFDTGTFNLTTADLTVGAGGLFGPAMVVDLGQTVNITNLAAVDVGSELTVLGDFSSGGLTNNGDLILIDTSGLGKTINGTVSNPTGSALTVVGDITFADAVNGGGGFFGPGTSTFAGGFSPGDSPGSVSFEGDVVFDPTNTLTIELGGLIAGSEFDQIIVASNASIAGVLDVSIFGGFVPTLGDSFQILTSASRAGQFASVTGNDLGGGLLLDVIYGATDITLQVIAALQGDLDGDGFVGISDLNIVLGNWNQNVPPANPLADPSGDGFVGIADLNVVLGNWNAGTPPGAQTSASVPEPGTGVLLLAAGCVCGVRKRRRNF